MHLCRYAFEAGVYCGESAHRFITTIDEQGKRNQYWLCDDHFQVIAKEGAMYVVSERPLEVEF